jgi:hypothetical protein
MNKLLVFARAARGKELRPFAKLSHSDVVDRKIDGETGHMEAPPIIISAATREGGRSKIKGRARSFSIER